MRSFPPSRAAVVRAGIAAALLSTSASQARAQTSGPPPPASLAPERAAWEAGDFDRVPALCQKALESGGLARGEVVEAYTRLGAALAIAGKSRPAAAAFLRAALIDPDFKVPPEAGKRAATLAQAARRAQRRTGALSLSVQVAEQVESGAPFGVDVTLSPGHLAAVTAITLDATDTLTARTYEHRTGTSDAHFDVPPRMTLPDASLLIRVHARDVHDNELAASERRVHVRPAPAAPPGPLASLVPSGPSKDQRHAAGGFWSSPWPYVIGGAALAAGGAATYFLTRPTENVDVGAVRVQLVH